MMIVKMLKNVNILAQFFFSIKLRLTKFSMSNLKNKRKVSYLKQNPLIRLTGKYLASYGFSIGSQYRIDYQLNRISIVKSSDGEQLAVVN